MAQVIEISSGQDVGPELYGNDPWTPANTYDLMEAFHDVSDGNVLPAALEFRGDEAEVAAIWKELDRWWASDQTCHIDRACGRGSLRALLAQSVEDHQRAAR